MFKHSSPEYLTSPITEPISSHKRHLKEYRVAIFMPVGKSSRQVLQGLKASFAQNKSHYIFDIYTKHYGLRKKCAGEKEAYEYIHKTIKKGYDAAFTIGIFSARMVRKVTEDYFPYLPVIFTAITTPQEMNIIASYSSSGNNFVGAVTLDLEPFTFSGLLRNIAPQTKRILIPYYDMPCFNNVACSITKFFEKLDIESTLLPCEQSNDINDLVKSLISKHDTLMFLSHDKSFGYLYRELAYYCNEREVIFYGDGNDAIHQGAGFAVIYDFEKLGYHSGKLLQHILENEVHPKDVPTQIIPVKRRLEVNHKVLKAHNIQLTPEKLFAIDRATGIPGLTAHLLPPNWMPPEWMLMN